ncbi:MAG: flagellar protein FlgN [Rhodospirillales bacterium]|nr:flagellar protein FlgN [Rhodospirillales bacterium]
MTTEKNLQQPRNKPSKAEAFILSRDPNRAMQEMMETIDAMRRVFIEENEALKEGKTKMFMSLQDKKIETAHRYQSGTEQLMKRRAELASLDPGLRRQLADMQAEFSELTAENLKALERTRKGVERLSNRIMSSARKAARQERVKYGASGQLEEHTGRVSIGINESA